LFFDCRVYDTTGLECNDPEMSMKLVFHAIIPLQFWGWDDNSSIYMRFGHPKLGDWVVDCGQFEVGRYGYHNIVLHIGFIGRTKGLYKSVVQWNLSIAGLQIKGTFNIWMAINSPKCLAIETRTYLTSILRTPFYSILRTHGPTPNDHIA
jgi:hypothetical protein